MLPIFWITVCYKCKMETWKKGPSLYLGRMNTIFQKIIFIARVKIFWKLAVMGSKLCFLKASVRYVSKYNDHIKVFFISQYCISGNSLYLFLNYFLWAGYLMVLLPPIRGFPKFIPKFRTTCPHLWFLANLLHFINAKLKMSQFFPDFLYIYCS